MIVNHAHVPDPTQLVTLADLCREAGWDCPVLAEERPVRVERLAQPLPVPADLRLPPGCGDRPVHWRNHPDGSYSTALRDAADIIRMLAYEAHEWQAWEVVRQRRRRDQPSPSRFALLT